MLLSARLAQREVVEMLEGIFRAFDFLSPAEVVYCQNQGLVLFPTINFGLPLPG